MAITRSIRNKLFVLLMLMGAIPLIVISVFSAITLAGELEDNAEKSGVLKNSIVSQFITDLCEKNFQVLRSLAINPTIIEYLQTPQVKNFSKVKNLLYDTNTIFHDGNLTALTGKDAEQLIRTDNKPLVNIKDRKHFLEAMHGKIYISDVIVSRSTGEQIVVLEVPVKDRLNYVIGMVQRNLNLSVLQELLTQYDTNENSIIVIDRNGKTIAHSDTEYFRFVNESESDGRYKYIVEKIKDFSGILRLKVDGKDALVSYSINWKTDWIILTVQQYDQILDHVYIRIFQTILIGAIILIMILSASHFLSVKATRPIEKITNATDKIVSGKSDIDKIDLETDDEFGQIAAAFNKIRSARDAYQMEAELDTLTKLYNKTTTENIGKIKLKTFSDTKDNDTIMAFYIIDLDHFKEANDTYGHQFGDKVLLEFSRNLRKKFRPNDCIGRFGGDEFVVIIDNLPDIDIIKRKARDINRVARELEIDGTPAKITASVGIAIIPNDGTDYETVFKAADEALYYVKANGRDGFYFKGAEGID